MQKTISLYKKSWIFIIVFIAGCVYGVTRTDVYVEGDDATSIAYHLLGRNKNLQPAYSPYQGMMDKLLSFLPSREFLLRVVSQDVTRVAAIAMIVLIMSLVFDWAKRDKYSAKSKILISFAVLLAVPEFFYFGLDYSPTLVAMCLVLSAHLVLRRVYYVIQAPKAKTTRNIICIAASLLLFGFGVAFRWNVIVYEAVIIVDLVANKKIEDSKEINPKLVSFAIIWGALAVLGSIIMIEISGYGFVDILSEIKTALIITKQTGTFDLNANMHVEEIVLTLSPMLSPGFIIFIFIGFLKVIRDRNPFWQVILISVLGILPWLLSGVPKFIIIVIPSLVFCFVEGFICVIDLIRPKHYNVILYIIIFLMLIGPWVIGIRVTQEGTAWGPGFELRPFNYSDVPGTKLALSFSSGAAFPTTEGPRPLYGHGYVLLGGGWNKFINAAAVERQRSIDAAISIKAPLVVTSWSPDYYLDDLYAMNYTTTDPFNRNDASGYFKERNFFRQGGDTVTLLYHELQGAEILNNLQPFMTLNNSTGKIVMVGYSQTLRALYKIYPSAMSVLGPNSAIIDLDVLQSKIKVPWESNLSLIYPIPNTGYLPNPGIGWQNDQDLVTSGMLPETVAYSDRLKIVWKILNPAKGVYDWSPLDEQISNAEKLGEQYSFRIITMAGGIYGGEMVPDWVLKEGAVILPSGEPDYSNCVYQQDWGTFVNALIQRYDGNPTIAFVDISGYGKFNEWDWGDQTEWDPLWDKSYKNNSASPFTIQTLDSQARRRLADIFIGGSFANHQCRDQGGNIQTVDYAYPGMQRTQLIMPYAGITQSTQYVYSRRFDVGFRYDCLGRGSDNLPNETSQIWRTAPIVYEFCSPDQFNLGIAQKTLETTHGSLVHNNGSEENVEDLQTLIVDSGYKYVLKEAQIINPVKVGGSISISMLWQNIGSALVYPKMGQNFMFHVYLLDESGNTVIVDFPVKIDLSEWMPADSPMANLPDNHVDLTLKLPNNVQPGIYSLKVSIINQRTNLPIQLAFEGADSSGRYLLSKIDVISG
jgi:hypothetical protein